MIFPQGSFFWITYSPNLPLSTSGIFQDISYCKNVDVFLLRHQAEHLAVSKLSKKNAVQQSVVASNSFLFFPCKVALSTNLQYVYISTIFVQHSLHGFHLVINPACSCGKVTIYILHSYISDKISYNALRSLNFLVGFSYR